MKADKIHLLSQLLYKHSPLPSLPLVDLKWVCHTLLKRLHLPTAFYSMVDNALKGVYWPDQHSRFKEEYLDTSRWKEKRPDLECMALIIFILKMVYKLDDVYEL